MAEKKFVNPIRSMNEDWVGRYQQWLGGTDTSWLSNPYISMSPEQTNILKNPAILQELGISNTKPSELPFSKWHGQMTGRNVITPEGTIHTGLPSEYKAAIEKAGIIPSNVNVGSKGFVKGASVEPKSTTKSNTTNKIELAFQPGTVEAIKKVGEVVTKGATTAENIVKAVNTATQIATPLNQITSGHSLTGGSPNISTAGARQASLFTSGVTPESWRDATLRSMGWTPPPGGGLPPNNTITTRHKYAEAGAYKTQTRGGIPHIPTSDIVHKGSLHSQAGMVIPTIAENQALVSRNIARAYGSGSRADQIASSDWDNRASILAYQRSKRSILSSGYDTHEASAFYRRLSGSRSGATVDLIASSMRGAPDYQATLKAEQTQAKNKAAIQEAKRAMDEASQAERYRQQMLTAARNAPSGFQDSVPVAYTPHISSDRFAREGSAYSSPRGPLSHYQPPPPPPTPPPGGWDRFKKQVGRGSGAVGDYMINKSNHMIESRNPNERSFGGRMVHHGGSAIIWGGTGVAMGIGAKALSAATGMESIEIDKEYHGLIGVGYDRSMIANAKRYGQNLSITYPYTDAKDHAKAIYEMSSFIPTTPANLNDLNYIAGKFQTYKHTWHENTPKTIEQILRLSNALAGRPEFKDLTKEQRLDRAAMHLLPVVEHSMAKGADVNTYAQYALKPMSQMTDWSVGEILSLGPVLHGMGINASTAGTSTRSMALSEPVKAMARMEFWAEQTNMLKAKRGDDSAFYIPHSKNWFTNTKIGDGVKQPRFYDPVTGRPISAEHRVNEIAQRKAARFRNANTAMEDFATYAQQIQYAEERGLDVTSSGFGVSRHAIPSIMSMGEPGAVGEHKKIAQHADNISESAASQKARDDINKDPGTMGAMGQLILSYFNKGWTTGEPGVTARVALKYAQGFAWNKSVDLALSLRQKGDLKQYNEVVQQVATNLFEKGYDDYYAGVKISDKYSKKEVDKYVKDYFNRYTKGNTDTNSAMWWNSKIPLVGGLIGHYVNTAAMGGQSAFPIKSSDITSIMHGGTEGITGGSSLDDDPNVIRLRNGVALRGGRVTTGYNLIQRQIRSIPSPSGDLDRAQSDRMRSVSSAFASSLPFGSLLGNSYTPFPSLAPNIDVNVNVDGTPLYHETEKRVKERDSNTRAEKSNTDNAGVEATNAKNADFNIPHAWF